jgi:uncharacterized protein YoaH (UPF0181 family)
MNHAARLEYVQELMRNGLISAGDAIDILTIDLRSVDTWLTMTITEQDEKDYPNAKIAADIKKTPLYNLL